MNAPEHQFVVESAAIHGALEIPLEHLAPSPTNPRKRFDQAALEKLGESIKAKGLMQPILARPFAVGAGGQPVYEIVAGERRWRGCKIAGLATIPAIVREMQDLEVLELQLIENLQRVDLHPLEEAEGYEAALRKPDGLQGFASADSLADAIGMSRRHVYNRLALCKLGQESRKAFYDGQFGASIALLIARMPVAVQLEAMEVAIHGGYNGEPLSYRRASDELQLRFMLNLAKAPFKITDETLVPDAGSCRACPKRSGANPDLFDDVNGADICTDSACFGTKKEAHQARLIEQAKSEGREVIMGKAAKKLKPQRYGELKDYFEVDKTHYELTSGDKTLGKLLGKDSPAIALLEDPHTLELVKVVKRDEALKVLKDKGLLRSARMPTTSDAQRKAEAKAKAESAWRLAVGVRAVAAVVENKFDIIELHTWLLPEVAMAMWERLDYETGKRVAKLLGWDTGSRYDEKAGAAEKRFRALTAAQLDQAFVAMAIAGQLHANQYSTSKPARLLAIASNLGIDAAAVRAELTGEARSKKVPVKTKAKAPAAKKAASVKTASPRAVAAAETKTGSRAAKEAKGETKVRKPATKAGKSGTTNGESAPAAKPPRTSCWISSSRSRLASRSPA